MDNQSAFPLNRLSTCVLLFRTPRLAPISQRRIHHLIHVQFQWAVVTIQTIQQCQSLLMKMFLRKKTGISSSKRHPMWRVSGERNITPSGTSFTRIGNVENWWLPFFTALYIQLSGLHPKWKHELTPYSQRAHLAELFHMRTFSYLKVNSQDTSRCEIAVSFLLICLNVLSLATEKKNFKKLLTHTVSLLWDNLMTHYAVVAKS